MARIFLLVFVLTSFFSPLAQAEKIAWQQWAKAPFLQARAEDKMILLDVGMEGCTACRWMDESTYTNSDVIQLVNAHFVAIVADAEAQPDVGERYSDWAWPATIFMSPDGVQVLALRGNRQPDNFIPILKELIERKNHGQLEADRLAPYAAPPEPAQTELTGIRDNLRLQLDRSLNDEYGGWQSRAISTASGPRLQHLYLRAHMYNNSELRDLALKTTDGYLSALDPVWGGVFVLAFHDDENRPARLQRLGAVPEKRISNQANALIAFSHAYKVSADEKYLRAIKDVDRYLTNWMMDEDGTFYTSQEDSPPALSDAMTTIDYWLLDSDDKRRQFGIPPIDHAIYTDKKAQVITAYASAYEATAEQVYLQTAEKAAAELIRSRLQPAGWMLQTRPSSSVNKDRRMRPLSTDEKPFLSAQAWFGTALLALYRVSGNEDYLNHANTVAAAMLNYLYDNKNGGFYATVADDTASIIPPRKPLELNALAARFFYDLWVYTKNIKYAKLPEQSLRAVATPQVLEREGKITGQTALALELLTASYVEFSVVGDNDSPLTHALFTAGRNTYHPRKLLHYEHSGRYPKRNQSALYICNPDRCSIPVSDPALVANQADSFRSPASYSP